MKGSQTAGFARGAWDWNPSAGVGRVFDTGVITPSTEHNSVIQDGVELMG